MSFSQWLRSNSEHYLLQDAQARIARAQGLDAPRRPKSLKDRFWRQVFAPVYRRLPWSVRRRTIQAMPGSHRQDWPKPDYGPRKPAI
jgi:hypothetical protein